MTPLVNVIVIVWLIGSSKRRGKPEADAFSREPKPCCNYFLRGRARVTRLRLRDGQENAVASGSGFSSLYQLHDPDPAWEQWNLEGRSRGELLKNPDVAGEFKIASGRVSQLPQGCHDHQARQDRGQ